MSLSSRRRCVFVESQWGEHVNDEAASERDQKAFETSCVDTNRNSFILLQIFPLVVVLSFLCHQSINNQSIKRCLPHSLAHCYYRFNSVNQFIVIMLSRFTAALSPYSTTTTTTTRWIAGALRQQQQQHQQQQFGGRCCWASTLVVSEPLLEDGSTPPATLSTATAARQLDNGSAIDLLVVGETPPTKIPDGINKVYHVPLSHRLSETVANAIEAIVKTKDCNVVVGASSKFGNTVIPRAAALLDVSPVTDILEIQSPSE
jgi:hypothetical protein